MPALPLDEAGKYVAGAYLVFLALLLIYVAIMATRLARIDRELAELAEIAEHREPSARASDEVAVTAPTSEPPGNAPTPAGNVAAGEASGGVVHEASGGVVHEASGGGVSP